MQCLEYSVNVSHDDSGSGEDDGEDGENVEEQRKKKRKFYDRSVISYMPSYLQEVPSE